MSNTSSVIYHTRLKKAFGKTQDLAMVRTENYSKQLWGEMAKVRAGRMAQWLRTYTVLAENQSSVSSSHWPETPALEDLTPSSGLQGYLHSRVYTYTHIHILYTHLHMPKCLLGGQRQPAHGDMNSKVWKGHRMSR